MNQIQHHDAVLTYLLEQVRTTATAMTMSVHEQAQRTVRELEQTINQLQQKQVQLYDAVDEANARANCAEHTVGHIRSVFYAELKSVITQSDHDIDACNWLETVLERAKEAEQKRADDFEAAVKPVDSVATPEEHQQLVGMLNEHRQE